MISKYEDFILERILTQSINENDMKASSDFLDRLNKIKKKNKIAKILYDLFDCEYYVRGDLSQNWIDVTDQDDTVSFLSDVKADKIEDPDDDSPFCAKGRSTIKVGRFVRALFKNSEIIDEDIEDLKDKDYEEFVNLYKSTYKSKNKKFKLVKGEDIAKWYNEDKYSSDKGTLGNSCMKDVKSSFFDIYVENDSCQLLVYLNNDKELIGRALVWKLEESPCEAKYFMDRVYTSNDSDVIKFRNYAIEQGWLYKNSMSADTERSLAFYYNDDPVFGKITVKLKKANFTKYPFVDTLSFLSTKERLLSNIGFKDGLELTDTGGSPSKCYDCDGKGTTRIGCILCDSGRVYVRCDDCGGRGWIECEACGGDGRLNCDYCDECGGDGDKKCKKCDGKCGHTEECVKCKGQKEELCPNCTGLLNTVKQSIKNEEYPWCKEYKHI